MKKRIGSLFLCLVLVLGMMPVNVLQVYAETEDQVTESGVSANAIFENESAEDVMTVSDNTSPMPEDTGDELFMFTEPVIAEPVTPETAAAVNPLANPVYVGGTALQYAGDSVEGTGGGTATLYISSSGTPVLVLDNYVYEGSGYKYTDGCYAGIYYADSEPMRIILGTSTSGKASENAITITAANATESYGIYVDTGYTNNLFIFGSKNDAADTLTVTGGPATTQSSGIKVTNGIKTVSNSNYEDIYTSVDAASTRFYMDGNFTVNAIGGTVSGEGAYSVGMDLVQGAAWNESVFDKGTFNATGGEASKGKSYGIRNSVVNDATKLYFDFAGATVTATGGTGKNESYGISCTTLTVSGGTVNAYGGDAGAEGYVSPISYGISCTDATLSGGTVNAVGGKASYEGSTTTTFMASAYGIKANNSLEVSGATVTATGGTCGEIVSGSDSQYSYGCYCDNITVSSGSLTATGADMLWECSSHRVKKSYGIRGGITATGGTVTATGGNTINGYCYGIYASGDCSFSGAAKVTAKTNDVATDDYIYGLYVANSKTITVADTAEVTVAVATEPVDYESFGIYFNGTYTAEKVGYTQTGGTVNVSAVTDQRTSYGAKFYNAKISGGTLNVSNKREALYATDMTLTGGEVKGTSTGVLADKIYYEPNGVVISTLTMEGGSLIGVGGETVQTISYGVKVNTAVISGGTVTGNGGHVSSETINVTSYGTYIKTLTFSGGTVTGTGGTASSSSYGVRIDSTATISNDAKLVGTGGISERYSSYGISGDTISVSGSATVTGTGGQAAEESRGIYVGEALNMSEGSSAKVTGIGGKGDSSIGLYISSDSSSLSGGTLTLEGDSSYTTESLGLYTWCYDFVLNGTIMTAKGYTSAVGGSDKFVKSEAIVADADRDGLNAKTLPYGNHLVSSLSQYKYLKAGTYTGLGVEPVKRDISDAVITLGDKLTYNGSEQTMVVKSVVLGGEDLLAAGDVTVTGNTVTNAGTYTLAVTANEESNYEGIIEKDFTVARLLITPTVEVSGAPYTYLSTVESSAVTVKHGETVLVEGVDYSIDVTSTYNVGENKGYVFVRCEESSNYNFSSFYSYFTVIKAENSVEMATSFSVIRGGNDVELAYTGNKTGIRPSFSFVGNDLGCTISAGGTLTSGDTVGTVTVCATFEGNEGYNETTRTITVTITEKKTAELAVTQNDATYNYDDTTYIPNVSFASPGTEIHKTVEYEGTVWNGEAYVRSGTKPTQAGEYTVYVTYETRDTIYTGSDEFIIKPRSVSVVSVTLGEDLTYNGTAQTKTVTRVYNSEYEFSEEEYEITDNVKTNAGNYYLKIAFKGNFTGEKEVLFDIAKATPQLSDFEIPVLSPVDYTGEEINVPLPTSDKSGMGEIYVQQYVKNAGEYELTFGVYSGDNYEAAEGFLYGTLVVNKVYRPITVRDAIVGINGKKINLEDRVEGEEGVTTNYCIKEETESLGCEINSGFLTSGAEAGEVTVQVTVAEDDNYLETTKEFTVTVVEVGGVAISGYVESSGSRSDENTIQLLQDGEVKHEIIKKGDAIMYLFDGVAAGTHILRVSKKDHVTYEREITVASEDLTHVDVQLVYMIGDVAATCGEFPSLLTVGENLPAPDSGFVYTTEPGETVLDANGVWQKKNGEDWGEVSGEIEAGATYRYKTTLKMDGENTTCTLADTVTLKVNDISWTVDYDTMQNSKKTDAYVTVYSPEIVGACIVSFAAGGGTGTMASVTGVLGEYTLPECGFTAPSGMRFKAWSVGGAEKAVGDMVDITAHTIITAVWEEIPHVHVFDRKVATDDYKASNATCKVKARFYMSCECGEKTAETFEYGNLAAHTYNAGVVTKQPTETETGIKTYTCSVCGATKTEVLSAVGKKPAPKGETVKDKKGVSYKVTKSDAKNGTVTYKKPNSKVSGSVTIPNTVTIDGIVYKVTAIEANAFKKNKKITKVTIGSNVTSIGKNAFTGCTKLTSVTIDKKVKTIGAGAFSGCSKLKTLKIGSAVTTISDKAFYKCTALTTVTIPSKVSKIGKSAFYGCKKLKNITIKTTKLTSKKVGSSAFKGTPKNATVKVPKKSLKAYKKFLVKKGIHKKAKIK
ncbi:MAG: leucine-rich repeat domain-containing protein [Lachnospiraceae bacterium]|nr:leucine-rich repeat domain-containing protein [Lachnospiraceae bacterium]